MPRLTSSDQTQRFGVAPIPALRAVQAHCRGRGDSDDTDATCVRILPGQLTCPPAPRAPPRCHRFSAAPMQKPPPFGRGFLA